MAIFFDFLKRHRHKAFVYIADLEKFWFDREVCVQTTQILQISLTAFYYPVIPLPGVFVTNTASEYYDGQRTEYS